MSLFSCFLQKYHGLRLALLVAILSTSHAYRIDLVSYFKRPGTTPSVSMDLELRSFWKRPKIAQILVNYRLGQKRILEEGFDIAEARTVNVNLSLLGLRKKSIQQIEEQFFAHFKKFKDEKAVTLWTGLWQDLQRRKLLSPPIFIFALPSTRERWVPADPYGHPNLEKTELELLELLGMLMPVAELTPVLVELYLRCHRIILPSLPESQQDQELFLSTPVNPYDNSRVTDPKRSISAIQGGAVDLTNLGKIQKDLLFLLHPQMRNFNWVQRSFFKEDTLVHVSIQILTEVRKKLLSRLATSKMDRSLDSLMELKRPGIYAKDLVTKRLNQIENEIFNTLETIRENKGIKRFYNENLILKSDLNELPSLLRILSPQLQDFTLEALRLLYRRHGYSDRESGKLLEILEEILLKNLPGVGKESIDLTMPRSR